MSEKRSRLPADPEITAPNVRAIYAVKVVALILILAFFWGIQLFISRFSSSLTITLVVLTALSPAIAVVLAPGTVSPWLLRASLATDVLALSWGVHLAGGVDNVSLPLLYPAVITLAGLLLTRADTFIIAGLSALSYSAIVALEYGGILPHLVAYSRPADRQLATVIPVSLYMILYAWLVSFCVEKLRALYRLTEAVRREAVQALSHDLKNPLSVIHGYARLQLAAPPQEQDQFAKGIERTAQQALDLVSNVLDDAAFDGRPLVPRRHTVQLNELVMDVTDRYRRTAEAAGVGLRTRLGELPAVAIDSQLVARALGNLISNGIKYGRGEVCVSTAREPGGIVVRVADCGPGITATELPLLFRRYSRTSSSRGIEGSGLGLYIVRCIAEAHGGSVAVESPPGQGATFTFSLPLNTVQST